MVETLVARLPAVSDDPPRRAVPRWMLVATLLGLYLTLRGYHSRDGDQAYRLPLLLHQQSPSLYEDDPFVRALDQFNPHRGAFLVLDAVSRSLGLSGGLFLLFSLTFTATYLGVDRLARETWPGAGASVGPLAFVLFLAAKAGNIGTNHLFEAMLLDRLQAFALGWVAIAVSVGSMVGGRRWIAPIALGLATLIHPSAGLQLAMISIASWLVWAVAGRWTRVGWAEASRSSLTIGCSVLPGLLVNAGRSGTLLSGLSPEEYWTLAVELQSPQHMLPHLWRMPQWLAWGAYFVLAAIALIESRRSGPFADPAKSECPTRVARTRLVLMLGVILSGLAAAWFGIEILRDVRITVFQPFRMATIARGISLILISGHVLSLWRRNRVVSRLRSALLVVGLIGDWLMVVVTAVEVTTWGIGFIRSLLGQTRGSFQLPLRAIHVAVVTAVLALGMRFLSRHDTESGHVPLLATLAVVGLLTLAESRRRSDGLSRNWLCSVRKPSVLVGTAWAVPILAVLAGLIPDGYPLARRSGVHALIGRCRFFETPVDDVERLAAWCRDHTPVTARFIGPPGPKTFRLWSRRTLAFNRSSSPYHASGLADWFARFRDHVGFDGSADEFVRQYVRNRHGIESRYQALNPSERTHLALRQGATHVIAAAPATSREGAREPGPLEWLHTEGRYAVYRVRPASGPAQLARSAAGDHRQR